MSKIKMYLAGPIVGYSYTVASAWRTYVSECLRDYNIICISPLRHKEYLSQSVRGKISSSEKQFDNPMATDKAVTARNKFDLLSSDIVFMNLLKTDYAAIGTMIELGWASAFNKPVIAAVEKDNIHDHAMVNELISISDCSLDGAIEIVKQMLY